MSLASKLEKWTNAGLISADQQTRILAFEHEKSGNRWTNGIFMVGLFSILIGIALIIASNWQEIPANLKLGVHVLVNAMLTGLVWKWHDDEARAKHREVALFLLWGLTLTLIALIGQVFQLGGEAYEALRVWFWLTSPMILLFSQSSYVARLWSLAFVFYAPYDLISTAMDHKDISPTLRATALLTGLTAIPMAAWFLGIWPRFAKTREHMADALRKTSIAVALLSASACGFAFHSPREFSEFASLYVSAGFILAIVVLRFICRIKNVWNEREQAEFDLICLCGLFICASLLILIKSTLLGMLYFILLWLIIGGIAQRADWNRLVSLSIAMVTIRIFIGFLQLFGTMLMSGVGFIIGGLVLLGLVKLARILDKRLKGAAA